MSSSRLDQTSHSLHEFKEIIKQVRECKTVAQERELINKEKALIRERFLQGKEETRAKDVAKLLYIAMLGHNTDFGQMECLTLISSSNFGNKRIGYLGLCQLFHQNSEVLMLATNHIHKDLNNSNNYVVSLAIVALSEICTAEMCRELIPDLMKQFSDGQTFVKKKAALCCVKLAKVLPEATSDIVTCIDSLIEDKHHGVLLSTVTLMKSLVAGNPDNKTHFYKHITPLTKILKALISNLSAEFDVNGVNDPFLQLTILEFFRLMAKGKKRIEDEISGILGEVASNVSADKNSGCSVLYECVKTVMEIESTNSLKILCLNVLGKFLKSSEPNIKYASLFMIQKVLIHDIKTVQKYMSTILSCLKEEDISIKQLSLDLIYMVSSQSNVEAIVKELLNHMMDLEQLSFLPELILQTCAIIDKFSPNRRWQIDTFIKVLSLAGNYAKEDTTNNIINLISVSPNLQQYATSKLFHSLKAKKNQKGLAIATLYCIGEYGEKLVVPNKEDSLSKKEVIDLVVETFDKFPESNEVKEYGMACLMKLVPKFGEIEQFKSILNAYATSTSSEVQKRACEYLHLVCSEWKEKISYVFQQTPEYAKAQSQFQSKPDDGQQVVQSNNLLDGPEDTPKEKNEEQNLLDDLLGEPTKNTTTTNKQNQQNSISHDLLNSIFENSESPLESIQNGTSSIPFTQQNSSQTNQVNKQNNIIDLLNEDPDTHSPQNIPSFIFSPIEDSNIKLVFNCSKVNQDIVEVRIDFGNKTNLILSDLNCQIAVQKYNKITVNELSSTQILPHSQSSTTLVFQVNTAQANQKSLQLKIRLKYSLNSVPITADYLVSDFPKGW